MEETYHGEFDTLYGKKIWVVIGRDSYNYINENFSLIDGYDDGIFDSEEEFNKNIATASFVFNQSTKDKGVVICFNSPPTFNTIVHEVTHATLFIAEYVGIKVDIDNDEPIAYLSGYIGECVHKFLTENKIKIKK